MKDTKFAQSALLVSCHDVLKEMLEEQHTAEQDWAQDGTLQSSIVETPDDSQSSEVGMTTKKDNRTILIIPYKATSIHSSIVKY